MRFLVPVFALLLVACPPAAADVLPFDAPLASEGAVDAAATVTADGTGVAAYSTGDEVWVLTARRGALVDSRAVGSLPEGYGDVRVVAGSGGGALVAWTASDATDVPDPEDYAACCTRASAAVVTPDGRIGTPVAVSPRGRNVGDLKVFGGQRGRYVIGWERGSGDVLRVVREGRLGPAVFVKGGVADARFDRRGPIVRTVDDEGRSREQRLRGRAGRQAPAADGPAWIQLRPSRSGRRSRLVVQRRPGQPLRTVWRGPAALLSRGPGPWRVIRSVDGRLRMSVWAVRAGGRVAVGPRRTFPLGPGADYLSDFDAFVGQRGETGVTQVQPDSAETVRLRVSGLGPVRDVALPGFPNGDPVLPEVLATAVGADGRFLAMVVGPSARPALVRLDP